MTAALLPEDELPEATELHPVEVDLLCSLAEVAPPFPLRIRSTGRTDVERTLMFRAAREQLTARGLAGGRGPVGAAGTFVRLLRSGARAIDLEFTGEEGGIAAVALVDGLRAVLVTQSRAESDQVVRLTECGVDGAVRDLLALVPALDAASVPAFTVPLRPLRRTFDRMTVGRDGASPSPLTDADIDELLLGSGMDERLIGRLVSNLRQVTGGGQAGIASWHPAKGRWQRLGHEVHWIDTARGRFRLAQDDDEVWASVNPFSRNDLRAVLRDLGARVRDCGNATRVVDR